MKFSIHKRWTSILPLVAAGFWLVIASAASGGSDAEKPDKDKKDDFPKFEEVTKDMEVKEGFYTLYFDKKTDTLLGRIPKASLGEPFLIGFSIPKGPFLASWMLGGDAYYWERLDKKLVLMEANTRVVKGEGSTVEDVIDRTYTDEIVRAIDIKTEAPGGDPVIDLGKLLKTDLIGLSQFYNGKLDASLSRWSTYKAFPNNVELAVDAAFMGKAREGGVIASLYLSISKLPKNGYKPRYADDRIGYFMTAQKDWTVPHTEKTVFKRKIHRWNVEKQDPKAAESPVKEPIIFYIEKTVPVKFRRYVREGILMWNKAFEKCGFLDAVQVRQQTDTNEFKDLDPEDVRYNFFRWIVSGRAFAMGPSRVNPFTGQILDADIIFDDSMLRFYVHEYNLLGPRAYDALSDPIADEFYKQYPDYQYRSMAERLTPRFAKGLHLGEPSLANDRSGFLRMHAEEPCELGVGMVQQLAFCQLAAAQAGAAELPEEFIGQILAEIVAHEVGHTLGLRHNFKASAWRKLDDILSPGGEHTALTGSVMDYNPAEFAPEKDKQADYVTRTIGPYDYWAIEYGYRPFMPGGDVKSEEEMLKSITDRVAEAGLAYATDEDTSDFGPDPYVYRYDKGDDPVAYAKHRMAMVERLRKDLADWSVQEGESYFRLRRAFNILLGEYSLAGRIAARMVGGQRVSRDHKGDPNAREPFVIVEAAKQREALEFVGDTVLSDKAFQFSPELLNKLGPGRFLHRGSDQMNFTLAYNIHDRILGIQSRVLTLLLNPITLNRIYDAELKVPAGEDALTVPDCVGLVMDTVWSELTDAKSSGPWTDRKPRITSIRRNLQREHLRRMISILLQEPGRGLNADSHAVVRLAIKVLGDRIDGALKKWRSKLDTYTLAHLSEASQRIDRALEAQFTDGASRETRQRGRRRAMVGGTESR